MTRKITSFVRKQVDPATAYKIPSRNPGPNAAFMNLNESPYPLSPRAQKALTSFQDGNRYPDYTQQPLREELATYVGFPADQIVTGAGLDDVFQILVTMLIDAGDEIVISDPTFGVYRSLFPLHGAEVVDVPLGPAPDFAFDAQGVIDAVTDRTKLVIICNPNNPTGHLIPVDQVEEVVKNVDCPVAIDEAYAEFSGTDHLYLARENDNAIVLRTLSKFAGLAGLRVGYGIFPASLKEYAQAATPAFANVSGLSAAVAIASLEDLDVLKRNRDEQVAQRQHVIDELNTMPGVTAYPSATNFVLYRLPMEDSTLMLNKLIERDIYVRRYGTPAWGLGDCLRVSIALPEENERFLKATREILEELDTE